MDKIYAIIPVNQFANAKTRLSPFLSPEERKNLLKAMLKDIATTLKPIVDKIIIISKDEEVLAYAEELELTAIVEEDHKPSIIDQAKHLDFIIVPSKGGGTNALIIKPLSIDMKFGGFSFKKHIEEAEKKKLAPLVHDSFYMALDVNTTEDLGEIMLHGNGTETKKYLESLGIKVESCHGHERLKVTRDEK